MVYQLWEVYEDDSQVSVIFLNQFAAVNQTIIDKPSPPAKSKIHLTDEEFKQLKSHGYLIGWQLSTNN